MLMSFNNRCVLFVFFFPCLNKQNVKIVFMICILHSENSYTFKMKKYVKCFKTVAKTCEKVLGLNMTSTIQSC